MYCLCIFRFLNSSERAWAALACLANKIHP
ncbi:hypothetical protein CP8484711_0901A, partial [Chlamydia psittaci 84-8471/1]